MFDLASLSELLRTDTPTALALVLDGTVPPPVILGQRLVRWSGASLTTWSAAGCPAGQPLTAEEARRIREVRIAELKERDWAKVDPPADPDNWIYEEDIA